MIFLSVLLLCSCTQGVQDKAQELVNDEIQHEAAEQSEVQAEETEEEPEAPEEVREKQIEFPEHLRPEGYDDPVLTKEAAKEILLEARKMQVFCFLSLQSQSFVLYFG